jgi:hypothetical protein
MTTLACPCGVDHSLSSRDAYTYVSRLVARLGPTTIVSTKEGAWKVPRIWIGIHGLKAEKLQELAKQYSWEAVP